MAFKKGQSGNPAGRPLGAKSRHRQLSDALHERGIEAAQLMLDTYAEAMADGDLPTAAKIAIEICKLVYTPPTQQIEIEQRPVRTLADYFRGTATGEADTEADIEADTEADTATQG